MKIKRRSEESCKKEEGKCKIRNAFILVSCTDYFSLSIYCTEESVTNYMKQI